MSAIDIVILLIIIVGLILGWRKGLIAQLGKIAALVAGVIACRIFGDKVAMWLVEAMSNPGDASNMPLLWVTIAYIVIFVSVYFAVTALYGCVRKALHLIATSLIDRFAGALFRVLLYLMAVSLSLNLWLLISPGSAVASSRLVHTQVLGISILTLAPAALGSAATASVMDKIWNPVHNTDNHNTGKDVDKTDR